MDGQRFNGELHQVGLNYGVVVPAHVVDALGGDNYIKVKGSANGIPFRKRLVPAGGRLRLLYLDGAVRSAGEMEVGAAVDVEIVLDLTEREHRLAPDVDAAISSIPAGWGVWDDFTDARCEEIIRWIEDAAHAATRARRIERLREVILEKL
ncbi:MAG: DUF1905 domain-containing protein [Acidimicrobiia bacterium]